MRVRSCGKPPATGSEGVASGIGPIETRGVRTKVLMNRNWKIPGWVLIPLLASSLPAPAAAATVRERLVQAAAGSRDLFGKSAELSDEDAKMRAMEPEVPEDREAGSPPKYARAPEVAAYTKLRPWSVAYRRPYGAGWPVVDVKEWPAVSDAGSLRKLLGDPDGVVRSLAVEALGSLYQPEDVPRIAALLDDQAAGAIVLGWSMPGSVVYTPIWGENPVVPERSWHERTVSTYAREALKIMTGHRFDGRYPSRVTFTEWWKTHNLGYSALWYWQQRLNREASARPVLVRAADETEMAFWDRSRTAARAYEAALHKVTVAELRKQPADVQWKVFLLTINVSGGWNEDGSMPPNSLFPDGLSIPLKPARLKELIAGTNLWSEVADVEGGRCLMLERLALCADQIVRGYAEPMAFKRALAKALEKEDSHSWNRPVLVSRLLLPAPKGRINDPEFREGYLRKALADENEIVPLEKIGGPRAIAPEHIGYFREQVAAEMVRGNLKVAYPQFLYHSR
ncbi:MAG TPA: HEAT repeat domain-containing protein [Armatimonadota bacterium]|jgi:hypothetical protein